jgi:hypothetical protein
VADLGDTLGLRSDLYYRPQDQRGVLINATTVLLAILRGRYILAPAPSVTNPHAVTGSMYSIL